MIPSYYPLPREQYLSAIGLQAFHGGYSNTSRKGLEYSIVRHRSVSGEKGDSGRSGVRGGIVKKKSRLWGEPQAGGLEPRTGLEPVTYALRMRRSTN